MTYGLLDYEKVSGCVNIGDYVQSLAAEQFLPGPHTLVSRESLSEYSANKLKMILNGWYMHRPENWPPSENIEPLFISFHINRPYANRMVTPEFVSYLREFEEVGCRDHNTVELLSSKGINAYYSGCLTMTLNRELYSDGSDRNGIHFVDVMHSLPSISNYLKMPLRAKLANIKNGNVLKTFRKSSRLQVLLDSVPLELRNEVQLSENSVNVENLSSIDIFDLTREYLKGLANARFVFTSRIHCALPCLAFGTPVVFIKHGQTGSSDLLRFRGILDHMNVLDLDGDMKANGFESNFINPLSMDWDDLPKNPNTHMDLAADMKSKVERFLQ